MTSPRVEASSQSDDLTEDIPVLQYQAGFGNEFETEALPGALPVGQNSPQKPPYGLISEMVSGASFTARRTVNRRSYLFRIRPSVMHRKFERIDNGLVATPPFGVDISPNHYGWNPIENPRQHADFVDGIATVCGNGSPLTQTGFALHVYQATQSMSGRTFSNADGEFLVVPHVGGVRLVTEFGILEVRPGEISVIPRGVKFRVKLLDGPARGFLFENFGRPLDLPELGLMGSNGLANAIDFLAPVAAYEDVDEPTQLVHKYAGNLWAAELDHSPLNVVAWRGSLYPFKYDLSRIVAIGALSKDHPDPSSLMVLTSPSDEIQGPNLDIMAFTPRWVVSENTFRPPGYHRNAVSEIIAVLEGGQAGLGPGSINITTNFAPHGPTTEELTFGREMELGPMKAEGVVLVVAESRYPLQVTPFAQESSALVDSFNDQWAGFTKMFPGTD